MHGGPVHGRASNVRILRTRTAPSHASADPRPGRAARGAAGGR